MTDERRQAEPTMEEILSSIRRIIAEDSQETPAATPAAPMTPSPVAQPQPPAAATPAPSVTAAGPGAVLTIPPVMRPPRQPAPAPAPTAPAAPPAQANPFILRAPAPVRARPAPPPQEPVLELTQPLEEPVLELTEAVDAGPAPSAGVFELTPGMRADPPAGQPIRPAAAPSGERLVSEQTELASAAALAILSQVISPDRRFTEQGQRLVEAICRERLEVMLREWLDANLAGLVERLVRQEIERMVERALGPGRPS